MAVKKHRMNQSNVLFVSSNQFALPQHPFSEDLGSPYRQKFCLSAPLRGRQGSLQPSVELSQVWNGMWPLFKLCFPSLTSGTYHEGPCLGGVSDSRSELLASLAA